MKRTQGAQGQTSKTFMTLGALCALCALACVGPSATPQEQIAWDVRGNYALRYDDTLTIRLNIGGAERTRTVSGQEQLVDLGTWQGQPLKLDLKAYCAREEVTCPSESLWSAVSIDQRDLDKKLDVHVLNVIDNTNPTLPAGARAQVRAGLVDHRAQGQFVIGLGQDSQGGQDCGVLGISLAGGRFERHGEYMETLTRYRDAQGRPCAPSEDMAEVADMDSDMSSDCVEEPYQVRRWPEGARVKGITDGKVAVGWLAACAFGPAIVGATLSIETGFVAERVGEYSPPPFTPVKEPTLPEESADMARGPEQGLDMELVPDADIGD